MSRRDEDEPPKGRKERRSAERGLDRRRPARAQFIEETRQIRVRRAPAVATASTPSARLERARLFGPIFLGSALVDPPLGKAGQTPSPSAKPREPIPGLSTKDVPVAVRRSLLHQRLPEVTARALRPFVSELTPEAVEDLDAVLLGHHERPGTDGSVSPKRALEYLVHEGGLELLSAKEQALLLDAVAQTPDDVTAPKSALALMKSGALQELCRPLRTMVCELFSRLDPDGRVLLAQLAARRLKASSALSDRDHGKRALVEHLLALFRSAGRDGVKRALAPLARPADLSLEGGQRGILTSLEHALAEVWPAEHARLKRTLEAEEVTTLAGGVRLQGPPGGAVPLWKALEALPQSLRAHPQEPEPSFVTAAGQSVHADTVARALGQLFAHAFSFVLAPRAIVERLEGFEGEGRQPPCLVSLRADGGQQLFVLDTLDAHGAMVRSPRGRSSTGLSTLRFDPPRRVIDQDCGLDQIPLDIFVERVGVLWVPHAAVD